MDWFVPGAMNARNWPHVARLDDTAIAVAADDVNGDAKPDLVTANQTSSTLSVLLNTTAGGGGSGGGSPAAGVTA